MLYWTCGYWCLFSQFGVALFRSPANTHVIYYLSSRWDFQLRRKPIRGRERREEELAVMNVQYRAPAGLVIFRTLFPGRCPGLFYCRPRLGLGEERRILGIRVRGVSAIGLGEDEDEH